MPAARQERPAVKRPGVPVISGTELDAILPGVGPAQLEEVLDVARLRSIHVRRTRIQEDHVALEVGIAVRVGVAFRVVVRVGRQ